ncbi:MAG: hypothetical protein Q9225_002084 [Loekoesia sp. 1 TL-2023]
MGFWDHSSSPKAEKPRQPTLSFFSHLAVLINRISVRGNFKPGTTNYQNANQLVLDALQPIIEDEWPAGQDVSHLDRAIRELAEACERFNSIGYEAPELKDLLGKVVVVFVEWRQRD